MRFVNEAEKEKKRRQAEEGREQRRRAHDGLHTADNLNGGSVYAYTYPAYVYKRCSATTGAGGTGSKWA